MQAWANWLPNSLAQLTDNRTYSEAHTMNWPGIVRLRETISRNWTVLRKTYASELHPSGLPPSTLRAPSMGSTRRGIGRFSFLGHLFRLFFYCFPIGHFLYSPWHPIGRTFHER